MAEKEEIDKMRLVLVSGLLKRVEHGKIKHSHVHVPFTSRSKQIHENELCMVKLNDMLASCNPDPLIRISGLKLVPSLAYPLQAIYCCCCPCFFFPYKVMNKLFGYKFVAIINIKPFHATEQQ